MAQHASSSNRNYESFISNIKSLQQVYARAGYFIRTLSTRPNARETFLALEPTKQTAIISKLQDDLLFYTECSSGQERLNNNKNLLEIFAYRKKLKIPSTAMEKINSKSLIEFYDHDLIQRFRSVNFFSVTSHSLEDLESRPFYELFKKSPETERKIGSVVTRIFTGATREPDFTTVTRHRLWEINSPRKLVTQNKTVALTPVFRESDDSVVGILHICNVIRQTELSIVHDTAASEPIMTRPGSLHLAKQN
jgi:hypothetical protein